MSRSAVILPATQTAGASPRVASSVDSHSSNVVFASAAACVRDVRAGYGSMPRARRRASFSCRCWISSPSPGMGEAYKTWKQETRSGMRYAYYGPTTDDGYPTFMIFMVMMPRGALT
jgi:hypothetical protein